ncbi:MAG: hypothetical protein KDA29_01710 [Phycisphaerales bacterium]|nr:hypothetical protein [Phycisphaerales bacterium]
MADEHSELKNGKQTPEKIPALVSIACFWPVALVAFGGLVGGILGGIAGAVNLALYRSKLPRWSLWLLNPAVGLAAFLLWLIIAVAIGLAMQSNSTG